MSFFLLATLLGAGISVAGMVHASESASADDSAMSAEKSVELYLPTDDAMADLTAALDAARESNRLLLVMMGANWCHDSRALASRIYEEPLSTIINEHYETLFVDVGFLENGKDVISSLGSPVYYATPTVLIVDPLSGQVINASNRHQWANAASISMEESLEYFREFAKIDLNSLQSEQEVDADLQQLLIEIEAFEQLQAYRLYEAYAVLAPMLRAYKAGDKEGFSEETWNEVRDFRYKVPADIKTLQTEARARVENGETNIKLNYPVYPAFSWDPQ
jgi:hypothetical protein